MKSKQTNAYYERLRKKNKRLKRIFIVLALIVLGLPFLGYFWFVISFSGGIDTIISDLKPAPNPKSSSVSAKRNSAKSDIEAAFSQLGQATGLSAHTSATYDHCYEGENNWKRKDGYAHRCDYRVTKYYGFNGDFRQTMLDLEQQLFKQQWQVLSDTNQLSFYIENYYDQYYGSKDRQAIVSFGDTYLVSDMPMVINGYAKNGMVMDVAYAEKDSVEMRWIERLQTGIGGGSSTYEQRDFVDVKAVFAEIAKANKYVLAVSLQKNYFEN